MTLLIDDFETGAHSFVLPIGTTTASNDATQQGEHIIGGLRRTSLQVVENLHQQMAQLTIGSGSLIISTGVDVHHRLEIGYGNTVNPGQSLGGINLFNHGDTIRFHFKSNNLLINFNVQFLTGTARSQSGVNMEGKPQGLPFVQDFSLNSFIGDGNAEAVDGIFVILQNGVFGQDYEITKIEVVNALEPV